MTEYTLQIAERQFKRQFERAIGRSVPKILAELITNADDSYKRIEASKDIPSATSNSDPAQIIIDFDRRSRRIAVTDYAEGLSDNDMKYRFVPYGSDSKDAAKGLHTRSLFGKGLRDVLFTQHHGQVKSIKDGQFANCLFRWKRQRGTNTPIVDIKPSQHARKQMRDNLGIPGNGTRVEFQLSRNIRTPQSAKLNESLSNFYMLRLILNNPNRKVLLRIRTGRKIEEHVLQYSMPAVDEKVDINDTLQFDGHQFSLRGTIGLTETELSQAEATYERQGGILVVDENDSVLDLTLFAFDDDVAARRISGYLRIDGVGDFVRSRLNAEDPEEIVTETRDGFNRHHPFYRALADKMNIALDPLVAELRQERARRRGATDHRTPKSHQEAMEVLNQLAREMLANPGTQTTDVNPRHEPPKAGIAFLGSSSTVRVGAPTPVPLLINTDLVALDDPISLSLDNPSITVSPAAVYRSPRQKPSNPELKILHVLSSDESAQGTLIARWGDTTCSLRISSTEKDILTPVDGLAFDRADYNVALGGVRNLRLFVDVKKIPIGSAILVKINGDAAMPQEDSITLTADFLVTNTIAEVKVTTTGIKESDGVPLRASHDSYYADTLLTVKARDKHPPKTRSGWFKGYEFDTLDAERQSWFEPREGVIYINLLDPVNRRYFGDDQQKAQQAAESQLHCQVRLADLILNECLQYMVSRALDEGKLERRFLDKPEVDVRRYVEEQQFRVGSRVHELLVNARQ